MSDFALDILPAAIRNTEEQAAFYSNASGIGLEQRWRAAVNNAVDSLQTMPERGALWQTKRSSLKGVRWIPIVGFPKHMIFYRVDLIRTTVLVLNVLHGARDIENESW